MVKTIYLHSDMKTIEVVAAIICKGDKVFATQRGYGDYYCHLIDDALHLNEHEAARWLGMDELDSVSWLPADVMVVNEMKKELE